MSAQLALLWRGSVPWKTTGARNAVGRWLIAFICIGLRVWEADAQSRPMASHAPTCATCHAGVAASYVHAPMHHALENPGADPVLETHPNLSTVQDGYTYTVQTKDGKSTYTVTDGKDSLTVPIRWMFGQHTQTWVLEKDGHFYESMVSYFPREDGLGTTPGDGRLNPHTVTEALGRVISTWETLQCFNCHATEAVDGTRLTLDRLRPGVECERCHAGAIEHMADAAKDNFKTVPKKLRPMDAAEAANFCGQCHRTWDTVVRSHWRGEVDVRFQPYRLMNSKCFAANDRRISCLACHDPHQQLSHDEALYDQKCLACHGAGKTAIDGKAIKACPVSKDKCSSCHMPKVELPGGHVAFTDHFIRVVHPGDAYPN